jgi:hypothetical protein
MSSRKISSTPRGVTTDIINRRRFLAAGSAVAVGSLAGCLNQVASSVTNTGASPAAVFAGTQAASMGEFVVSEPHVSRLTPTVSGGPLGDVELEGWVTSSPVMAQNHNSSRSNAPGEGYARDDEDSDGDGLSDADEDDELVAYLGGKPIIAERFSVCLPDAEVPGGNGSIRDAVTPERLLSYLTGETGTGERVYSWGTPKAGPEDPDTSTDCDDDDPSNHPGAVCGTTPHFVAEVEGPVATGSGLGVVRAEDGTVFVLSESEGEPVCGSGGEGRVGMLTMRECGLTGWPEATGSGSSTSALVYQVMVQPPRCPESFPALFYVQRCESNDQLVYTGGWVIDDAALHENSTTVVSMAGPTEVVGVERSKLSDLTDMFEDVAGGGEAPRGMITRRRRGARLDSGTVEELVEVGVLSEQGVDVVLRKRPGRRAQGDGGEPGENYRFLTHVSVDVPVLHLVGASRASQDVKFKAGAELSKAVN